MRPVSTVDSMIAQRWDRGSEPPSQHDKLFRIILSIVDGPSLGPKRAKRKAWRGAGVPRVSKRHLMQSQRPKAGGASSDNSPFRLIVQPRPVMLVRRRAAAPGLSWHLGHLGH